MLARVTLLHSTDGDGGGDGGPAEEGGGDGGPLEGGGGDGGPAEGGGGDGGPTEVQPRQSERHNKGVPPLRYIEQYLAEKAEEESKLSPKTVKEAFNGKAKGKWEKAMASEMQSLKDNGVYEVVDRPKGKKVGKSRWVFRVKTNEKGEVEKHKA